MQFQSVVLASQMLNLLEMYQLTQASPPILIVDFWSPLSWIQLTVHTILNRPPVFNRMYSQQGQTSHASTFLKLKDTQQAAIIKQASTQSSAQQQNNTPAKRFSTTSRNQMKSTA